MTNDSASTEAAPRLSTAGHGSAITVPQGYVRVWDDDRLNPMRGRVTALGNAQTDAIWTNDVPRELKSAPAAMVEAARVNTDDAAPIVQALPGTFVQVGAFADAQTVAIVSARLAAAGIPARRAILQRGRSQIPLVLAGPYANPAVANDALAAIRQKGFPDAFIRN